MAANDFGKKIIFHTHVEKAAGTTIIEGLKEGLGAQHVHDMRFPHAVQPQKMTSAEKSKIWVLTGHFHFGAHMDKIARSKLFIASVRHPFDRFRSYVNYIGAGHPAYRFVGGKSFAEVIEEYLENKRPAANNQMARVLTGVASPTFQMVTENIEKNYLFVSPHRRVNEALAELLAVTIAKPSTPENHSNKGPKKVWEDVGDWEAKFNAANAIDVDLHKYVEDNFDRWTSTIEERWNSISATKEK
jgi:hypothetical protein